MRTATAAAPTSSFQSTALYPTFADALPGHAVEGGSYRLGFARSAEQLDEILRLRFKVFNLEMGEGLASSYATGRDEDEFEPFCHHLYVEQKSTGRIVGTYRMQSPEMAAAGLGLYTATEYDLSGLPAEILHDSVEVGRACIAREHRGRQVLFLLWKGLATYLAHRRKRFLFGCCSLPSQNPLDGARALAVLRRRGAVSDSLWLPALPEYACPEAAAEGISELDAIALPPLFEIYLRYRGKVISPPALDRRFGTLDFLVLTDTEALDGRSRQLFFNDPPTHGG